MNLDRKTTGGWGGIGKEGKTISYINQVLKKPDAAVFGNYDSRPVLVEGKKGKGVSFKGDCGLRFSRDLDLDRHQPFSLSIWVKVLKKGEHGPIFLNANGDFEGYRGWGCLLNEDGTLNFQMIHTYPDNAIIYKTKEKVSVGKWTHITMAYDGSSQAKGLHFYINGKRPEAELLEDNLQKSVLHAAEGKNWTNYPFTLGKENASSIENIVMDELLVYNRQLSDVEAIRLYDESGAVEPTENELLDYYVLSGKNRMYNKKLNELTKLRAAENDLTTNFLEVMVMSDKEEVRPTFILDRGMYDAPKEEVQANTP